MELDVTTFFGIQVNQNKKDSCHKLTLPTLIKVLTVTRTEDCNSKPAPCSANGKPLRPDPEGAPAKESNSTLTKQALITDDFHNVSSPFVRKLDNNNDEINKPLEEFDLINLCENNHELEDGSQLDFVIRKHGGKKSLTLFVKTDPEDKTNTFDFDVTVLSLLNCKGPSWICWDTFETKKTNTNKQFADCLTESLKAEKFAKTQQMLCGWHCLTESLTLCETSLHFIVTSFKRECCWNVPRCTTQFRLECLQFEAHSFSLNAQDSGTKTGSLSLLSDKIRQNRLILLISLTIK